MIAVDPTELYRVEMERRRGSGKRVRVPVDVFRRVYEGRASADDLARDRNITPPTED